MNWRKHCTFQQPFWSSTLKVAFNFFRGGFFAPQEWYIKQLVAGLAQPIQHDFAMQGIFKEFSRIISLAFNCSRLAFGISQANTIKV